MLTPRQKQILDFITKYNKRRGVSPSLEEIKKHFRLRSVSGIHQHLETLKNKGYLNKAENQPRGIEVKKPESSGTITIPLLGVITAGEPVEAYEVPEKISVPKNLVTGNGNHFALKVNGNSMIGDGIFDGDTVIIRKQQTAEDGETVVALINDSETTLKKIYKEKNGFRLQPANPELKPIFVKRLIVQGKVVGVIRNFEEQKEVLKDNGEFEKSTIDYVNKTNIEYRKSLGQYFTPKSIREKLLSKLPISIKNPRVLDPACGTGEFLLSAKRYFSNPEIHGWDIDENLVKISKRALPDSNLKNIDSLLNNGYGKFDFVIGNPPYFEFNPSKEIREKFKEIINGRVNIFSLFIYQGIKWLKDKN